MTEDPYLAATEAVTVNLAVSLGAAEVELAEAATLSVVTVIFPRSRDLAFAGSQAFAMDGLVGELGGRGQVPDPPGAEERRRDLLSVLLRGRPGRDHAP